VAQSVYIETSIPSAYVSTRTDLASKFRREETRLWWQLQRDQYDVLISENVLIELYRGNWPGKSEAIQLVEHLPRLPTTDTVEATTREYIKERLVPADIVDFLLTWNIRHLANPNKTKHLAIINQRLGFSTPVIITPEALWTENRT
jgi:hypothetical protein